MSSTRLLPQPRGLANLKVVPGIDYRDRYRGAMLGVGIGDALGRPAEGMSPSQVHQIFGVIDDFKRWRGWQGGPKGTFTDDSELTLALAESLIERGEMDPVDFGRRCGAWVEVGRGKGRATVAACQKLASGVSWDMAGTASAGNGAAMRAAPIGLAHPVDMDLLRLDAALSAVVTHADPTAVLSAVAMAYLVAELLHTRPGELDIDGLLTRLHNVVQDLPDPAIGERKPGGGTVRLLERLLEMGDRLDQAPAELFAYTYNGALVTESLPAALWCFLRSPNEPERVLVTAVNQGHDADTVAAMAGAMAGAYNGVAGWPGRWLNELEYGDGFEGCADDLLDLSGLPADAAPEPRIWSVTEVSSFLGPFAFLSNSARTPIEVEGLHYPTVEHAYSSRQVADEAVAAQIRLIPTPSGAIERRRRVPAKPDWVTERVDVMEQLLAAKFAPGTRAASQLLATGKAQLQNEVWWDDTFWGVVDGIGENRLGRKLDELRNRLA